MMYRRVGVVVTACSTCNERPEWAEVDLSSERFILGFGEALLPDMNTG